jgi:hypothetical protein
LDTPTALLGSRHLECWHHPSFQFHPLCHSTNRALVTPLAQLGSRCRQCRHLPSFQFHLVSNAPNRALVATKTFT